MNDSFNEICAQLLETNSLYRTKLALEKERGLLPDVEASEKEQLLKSTRAQSENIINDKASAIKSQPKAPKALRAKLPNQPKKHGCKSKTDVIIGGVLGFLMYASFILAPFAFVLPILLFVIGGCIAVWATIGRKRASIVDYDQRWAQYQKQIDKWEAEMRTCDNQDDEFIAKWGEYDMSFFEFLTEADEAHEQLKNEYNNSYMEITQRYIERKEEISGEIDDCEIRLEEIGIISPRYYYLALDIHDVLYNGRADSLKEALNIAIDDERKANDEAERRAAERRQEAILQNQADETFRHQQRMENEARTMAQDARNHQAEMERETRSYHQSTYSETVRHNREMENMFRR